MYVLPAKRRFSGLVAGFLLALPALGLAIEDAKVEAYVEEGARTSIAPVIPVRSDGKKLRWNIRPFVGVSMVSPGELNSFANDYVTWWRDQMNAKTTSLWYGALVGPADERAIQWAVVEGATVGYQVTPLMELAVRFSSLRSQHGRYKTRIQGLAGVLSDAWTYEGDILVIAGGGGFKLTLTKRTRVIVSLLVGIGIADVSVGHRRIWFQTSGSTLSEAHADLRGTAFVPEFSAALEHDIAPSLSAGIELGYKFVEIDSLKYRRPTNLYFLTSNYAGAGSSLRNSGGIVGADFGGLILSVNLTARI